MRKILTKIICAVLMVCLLCSGLVGCGKSWKNENLQAKYEGAGNLVQNGGFVAETDNYVYFINGLGDSTADNTLGAPLKGALLVAQKSDLTKTEVVVPKLLVATDINAGLFIDDGYVYYGTPSTEKNASGAIAKEDITFMRTKLDGSGDTDVYFTKESALGLEYRIVKGANGVCIYYYESENSAIVCYNTATKTATDIITTDEKTEFKPNADVNEYISLSNHMFLDNNGSNGVIAVLTATVYTEAYDEAKAEASSSYSRITASYNKVYAIKAGENKLTEVVSGANTDSVIDDESYQIILANDQYMFYEKTTATNNVKTYAVEMSKLLTFSTAAKTEIVNAEYVDASNVIVSLEEVYVIGESKVYKTTLLAKDNATKEPICLSTEISQPLYVKDNFLYFYDKDYNLARISVAIGSDYKIVRVSEGAVATTWFFPEFITVNSKQYLVYAENTTTGQNYLRYFNITDAEVKSETEDDVTTYYLDAEVKDLCQRTDADKAKLIDAKANAITELIPADGVTSKELADDSDLVKAIAEFKNAYNNATEEVKELVDEASVTLVDKYERVIEIAKLYDKLAGVEKFNTQAQADASGIKTIYQDNKSAFVEFKSAEDREDIDALISTNLKAYYTIAVKWYEAK